MMTGLLTLACAAMMALMCLPMAVRMLRSRFTRRGVTDAGALAATPAGERHPPPADRGPSTPHH